MDSIAGENRNIDATHDLPGAVGTRGVDADITKIRIQVDGWVPSRDRCFPAMFGALHLCQTSLIVGTSVIRMPQIGLQRKTSQGLVWSLSSHNRVLSQRQPYESGHAQACFRQL